MAKRAVVTIEHDEGTGSGVIFRDTGELVTSAHVLSGSDDVTVRLSSGMALTAEVFYRDEELDLALLRLPGDGHACLNFTALDQSVGQDVFVIGAPAGPQLAASVSKGIISGFPVIEDARHIQTDASINPGSSGGPILNADGRIIGIARAKVGGQGFEGLGFGTPSSTVMEWLQNPRDSRVERSSSSRDGLASRVLRDEPAAGFGRVQFTADRPGTLYQTREHISTQRIPGYRIETYEHASLCVAPCVMDIPVGSYTIFGQSRERYSRNRRLWVEEGDTVYVHSNPIPVLRARRYVGLGLVAAGVTLASYVSSTADTSQERTLAIGGGVAAVALALPIMFVGGHVKVRDEPIVVEQP